MRLSTEDGDRQLVEVLYAGILRRAGEPAAIAHWVSMLRSGQTPAAIVTEFLNSDEARKSAGARLFVPPGHFYSPIVDPTKAATHLDRLSAASLPDNLPGIAIDRTRMRAMWHTLLPYLTSAPFTESAKQGLRYCYDNPAYSFGDGSVLHAMLRHYKPKRMIEVGSGWSSVCTIDTVELFLRGQCKLTFIEPHPQLLKDLTGNVSMPMDILTHRVEETPLALFETLDAGDILFIDSTHVLATASDVCFELFEILPRLKPGVLVHFHDMFWPFEYPRAWAVDENRSWNELYAVRALLTDNPRWEILFFNDYFGRVETKTASQTFPTFLKNPGGALWLVKKEVNRRESVVEAAVARALKSFSNRWR
jgi:hypothetical protein